jgi:predicted RNA-binding Zn-ribbon protein involved in translation (DUF1610 family)
VTRIYTRKLLEPLCRDSTSVAQVLRKLGLRDRGSVHTHISKRIREYGIDTSHFTGQAWNRGRENTSSRLAPDQVLIKQDEGKSKTRSSLLRRAMLEHGIEYRCEKCDVADQWNGSSLTLQVDHRNGDTFDHRPNNVRFLCPNCHSQTETWGRAYRTSGCGGMVDAQR